MIIIAKKISHTPTLTRELSNVLSGCLIELRDHVMVIAVIAALRHSCYFRPVAQDSDLFYSVL